MSNQIEDASRLIGQLSVQKNELDALANKVIPSTPISEFQLKIANEKFRESNKILPENYRPSREFSEFESNAKPTISDVTMMLSKYIQALTQLQMDNNKTKVFKIGG